MATRESHVFTFDPRYWTARLIDNLFEQTSVQCGDLSSRLHGHLDRTNQRPPNHEHAKLADKAVSKLKRLLMTKMKEQTDIFRKYLERYVFKIPCDAIVAVMSQQVPVSRKKCSHVAPHNARALFSDKFFDELTERLPPLVVEAGADHVPGSPQTTSDQNSEPSSPHDHLRHLQLSLQKSEYFNRQLSKRVQEHQAYLETLEKIWLHLNLLGGSVDAANLGEHIHHLVEESHRNHATLNQIEHRIERYKEITCSTSPSPLR